VRFCDRWVRVEPELMDLMRRGPGRTMPAAEALAAVLTGTMAVGGRSLPASAVGRIEQLGRRLRELAGPRLPPLRPDSPARRPRPRRRRGGDGGSGCDC
jgi:hypothetical protein